MENGDINKEQPPLIRDTPLEGAEDPVVSAPLWQGEALSKPQATKAIQVLEACNKKDVRMLIAHAISPHGLVEDDLRRLACTFYYPT